MNKKVTGPGSAEGAIEVLGSGSLEEAVATTLSNRFSDIESVFVSDAAHAYAVTSQGHSKIGLAFYLTIHDNRLYLVGGREASLNKTDSRRLCCMPTSMINQLTESEYANAAWRKHCRDYDINHRKHLFRGAILESSNPPDIYREGKVSRIVVTHPPSHKAFDQDGSLLLLPKEFRSFYTIKAVPMIDESQCRPRKDDKDAVRHSAMILTKNLSFTYSDEPLTARLLQLGRTQPMMLISKANDLTPLAISKEPSTFELIDSWGLRHNQQIGHTGDFTFDKSMTLSHSLDNLKIADLKAEPGLQADLTADNAPSI